MDGMAAIERAWRKVGLPGPAPDPWYYPSIAEYAVLLEKHGLEVSNAILFERPTALEDGERGLRNWLEMFGGPFLDPLSREQREQVLAAIEQEAGAALLSDGHWVIDYRRLRIVARRESRAGSATQN